MQIWFLSNGSYSLKKCHNPFGNAIQPPPPYGKIPVEHLKSLHGASLSHSVTECHFRNVDTRSDFMCIRARWDNQLQNQNPSTWIWKENLILKLFCSFKFFDLSAPSAVPGHFWWIFTFLFSLTWSETAYHFITIVTPFHHCYPTYDK